MNSYTKAKEPLTVHTTTKLQHFVALLGLSLESWVAAADLVVSFKSNGWIPVETLLTDCLLQKKWCIALGTQLLYLKNWLLNFKIKYEKLYQL